MIYLLSLLSIITSIVLLKIIVAWSYKMKVFDSQGGRKIHHGNIPRVGGIAFVPAAICSFLAFLIILIFNNDTYALGVHDTFIHDAFVMVGAIAIIYVFGIFDDVIGLRYRVKFGYQILTGLMICFLGIFLWELHGILALYTIPMTFGFVITIFLLIFSINSFNFIDGIDGLSSGIAILSLSYFSVILYLLDNKFFVMAIFFLCAVLPFFFFNVFGKEVSRTKTFMGDTGSTVLGLVLFLLAVAVNEDINTVYLHENAFILGFTPLLLPFYDTISVVFYRLLKGKNPFKADDNHFHHKLLRLGLSQHSTLIVELIVFVVICVSTLFLPNYINLNIIIGCSLLIWLAINQTLLVFIKKKKIIKN